MTNTTLAKYYKVCLLALVLGLTALACQATPNSQESQIMKNTHTEFQALTTRQEAIIPIAAFAAMGDMIKLAAALNQGLDQGLTVNDTKEVLVQLYAYAGFPRSLNATAELMKVVEARKQRGIQDAAGRIPSKAIPQGDDLLAAGTANQTKLAGGPVAGALFEFSPALDEYLKTHLFGDIFERDNFGWQERELATVSMLATLPGVESQLKVHMQISMNTGVTTYQLDQLIHVLEEHVDSVIGKRARGVFAQISSTVPKD